MLFKKGDKKWGGWWWLTFLLFTGAYLVAIGILGSISSFEISRCSKSTWSAITSGCLTLNELGDFLAGAFAPGAFMLLAATVFMQSRELKKQSEDIRQTRDIMKAQLGFVKQQTAFLKQEQKYREAAEVNRIFRASIGRLAGRLSAHPNSLSFTLGEKALKYGVTEMRQRLDENENAVDQVIAVSQKLNRSIINFNVARNNNMDRLTSRDVEGLQCVHKDCLDALDISKNGPQETSWLVETIELKNMMHSIEAFAKDAGVELVGKSDTKT
ncbi:MAG: hypothetical protein JKY82_02690 [Rhizobiaceae bacterium]|nr:hypothetical protein [Rhizobiaceae bacterium]